MTAAARPRPRPKKPSEVKNAPRPPDQPRWAIEGKTAREVYLAELANDMTIAQVARKYGVSRQAVHQATVGLDRKRTTDRPLDRDRKRLQTSGVRGGFYRCTVCNSTEHRSDNPECPGVRS